MAGAEVGSGFDVLAIPFMPKTSTLKTENSQEFNLCIFATNKNFTYKLKAHTFANGSPKDMLEPKKKMQMIIKCKLVDMVEGKFDLVDAILEGDASMHWLKFKPVAIVQISKNPDGSNMPRLGMCDPALTVCPKEFKRHFFPKNLACLQKAHLCDHI
eukprot:15358989-Ditylum_brightwellii.AAC.1